MIKCTVPIGTEIKVSEIGYYDYWYPSSHSHILCEEIEAEKATGLDGKFPRILDWEPLVVTQEVAENYGSPVRIVWVEKKNVNT